MQWWCIAWPGVSRNTSGRPASSIVMPSVGLAHALRRQPERSSRTNARSPRRRRPRSRCVTSRDGSIRCRAPRGCTTSVACGRCCISRPMPPAWSRWTWVAMTRSTASGSRPSAARARRAGAAPSGWCRCRRRRRGRSRRSGRRRRNAAGESRCRSRGCRGRALRRSSGRVAAGASARIAAILESTSPTRIRRGAPEWASGRGCDFRSEDAIDRQADGSGWLAGASAAGGERLQRPAVRPATLPLGTPIDTARHAFGGPTGQYPLPGGGTRLEFALGSFGQRDLHARFRRRRAPRRAPAGADADDVRNDQAGHVAGRRAARASAGRCRCFRSAGSSCRSGTIASAAWRATACCSRCRSAMRPGSSPRPARATTRPATRARVATDYAGRADRYGPRAGPRRRAAPRAARRGGPQAASSWRSTNGRMPPCR